MRFSTSFAAIAALLSFTSASAATDSPLVDEISRIEPRHVREIGPLLSRHKYTAFCEWLVGRKYKATTTVTRRRTVPKTTKSTSTRTRTVSKGTAFATTTAVETATTHIIVTVPAVVTNTIWSTVSVTSTSTMTLARRHNGYDTPSPLRKYHRKDIAHACRAYLRPHGTLTRTAFSTVFHPTITKKRIVETVIVVPKTTKTEEVRVTTTFEDVETTTSTSTLDVVSTTTTTVQAAVTCAAVGTGCDLYDPGACCRGICGGSAGQYRCL